MANLNEIRARIAQHGGFAKLNKYRVILPPMLGLNGVADMQTLDILCRSVTLPGKAITSIARKTNMKEFQIGSGYTVDTVNVRFTETSDYFISRYLDAWQSLIVNSSTYEVAYRSEYARDVVIIALDDAGRPIYVVTLLNAFPKSKILVDMSDFSANTLTEVGAIFEYEDFYIGTANPGNSEDFTDADIISRHIHVVEPLPVPPQLSRAPISPFSPF